jgi:hypothetical protein
MSFSDIQSIALHFSDISFYHVVRRPSLHHLCFYHVVRRPCFYFVPVAPAVCALARSSSGVGVCSLLNWGSTSRASRSLCSHSRAQRARAPRRGSWLMGPLGRASVALGESLGYRHGDVATDPARSQGCRTNFETTEYRYENAKPHRSS